MPQPNAGPIATTNLPALKTLIKGVYRNLEDAPLYPGNAFYENIYERYEGEDPVAKLRTKIEFAEVESLQFFSGFRGAGKTTELFRLKKDLIDQGYVVLYANAMEYLSDSEEIDIVTMLMGVAGAFGEQVTQVAGTNALKESFWKRIIHFFNSTNVVVDATGEIGVGIPTVIEEVKAGIDLKMALKTAPSFRQKLQKFLANRLGEFVVEVNTFIEEGVKIIRAIKGDNNLPIIFLFDNFEQLRGSRLNEQAVIASVERLFTNHREQLRLRYVHVIYTVPPWLQFILPAGLCIVTLPCVRLWKNDDERTRYEPGWDLLREAIKKRFGSEHFAAIFGQDTAKSQSLTDQLIAMSGGHFRDLLRLFREAILLIQTWRPTLPMTDEVVQRAINNIRNEFLPIALSDAIWLDTIATGRGIALPSTGADDVGRLSRFLDTHLVLYLKNGTDWYDIHPLIRDEVKKLAIQASNSTPQ